MKIIMNPPYKRNLHLKILSKVLETFLEDNTEVVNLSPIGWLQDPLAEFKQGTEFKKFSGMLDNLSKLDVVSSKDADRYFGTQLRGDLAIYHFTKEGDFDLDNFRFNTPEKKLAYRLATEVFPRYNRFTTDMDTSKEFKFTFPTSAGTFGQSNWGYLCTKNKEAAYSYQGNFTNKKYGYYYVIVSFDTPIERDNFHSSLFTKFYQFCVWHLRRDINIYSMIPFLPHLLNVKWTGKSGTIDGYKNPITDEMLYEYFELTDEEIQTVEDFFEDISKQK